MIREIHSNRLNKKVVLDFIEEDSEFGGKKKKATHNSLVKVFNRLISEGNKLKFEYSPIDILCDIRESHVVFSCKLIDCDEDREYFSIGETSKATLSNEISAGYPALMAMYRGFDLCFKQFLDLDENIYSDAEIPAGSSLSENNDKAAEETIAENKDEPITVADNATVFEEVPEEADSIGLDESGTEIDLSKPIGDTAISNADAENFKILFGKYKGKTIREIYNENASYLDFLLEQTWLKPDAREHIETFKKSL